MKNKFFTFLLLITIVSGTLFISCKKEDDDSDNSSSINSLKYLSIANAKNLYISTAGGGASRNARASTSSTQRIFKITEDGYTEEVKYLNKDKAEISISQQPTAICPVNNEYIFVGFGWGGTSITSSYLVRKTDGAVFSLANAGNPSYNNYNDYKNSSIIKTDKQNNLYFLTDAYLNNTWIRKIVKVNLSGVDSLQSTTVSASTDRVSKFDVDWNGNIIYEGSLAESTSSPASVRRLKKLNGGLVNLGDMSSYWIGLDGCIYYCSPTIHSWEYDPETGACINSNYGYPIKKITVDSSFNVSEEIYGYLTSGIFSYTSSYKIDLKNKIYIISGASICEVYNEAGKPRNVLLEALHIKSIASASSSENYYYIMGSDSSNNTFLVRVNPEDDSYIHLLPQNEYDVYSFTASEENGVIFNALRMSDGKKVIGKVGINGGAVKMIDEESDVKISYLERIN